MSVRKEKSMDALSQELIELISSHLNRDDLKNTLYVSRKFQVAAEKQSGEFETFTLTANADVTERFFSVYSTHRFRFLRKVVFETTVGALYDEEDAEQACRDTEAELQAMDDEFTEQIQFLYTTLNAFESKIQSSYKTSKRIHLEIYTPTRALYGYQCYHRKFCSWRVHLLSPCTLLELPFVQVLEISEPLGQNYDPSQSGMFLRKVDHRVILDLASKCPNLEKLQCTVGANEWLGSFVSQAMNESCQDWPGPRRDSRHNFGKPLQESKGLDLPLLREVELNFLSILPWIEDWDERLAIPNLIKPALFDPFSTSLRILSYQLRRMNLHLVADSTLFWPSDDSEALPLWPNMESLNVTFHISHPSGSWYFVPPLPNSTIPTQGFDITPEHYPPFSPTPRDTANDSDRETDSVPWNDSGIFTQCHVRAVPNDELLVPFLSAFAKAAARMPLLKDFALWSSIQFHTLYELPEYEGFDYTTVSMYAGPDDHYRLSWGIVYAAPGEQGPAVYPKEDCLPNRRIWWRVGRWRPDAELHGLLAEIGHEEHGGGLEEFWNEEYSGGCGNGLGYEDWFERWERRRWPHSYD